MAEAADSVNIPAFVSIHAALDCVHDRNPALLTAPLSRRRYDCSTLDHLRDRLIAMSARCRGQVDRKPPQWIELVDFHFDYHDFPTPEGEIAVLVAISEATYPAAEIEDRSAPQYHPDAAEARYCLVARNLKVETATLLRPAEQPDSAPQTDIRSNKDWLNGRQKMFHPTIPTGAGKNATRRSLRLDWLKTPEPTKILIRYPRHQSRPG